MVALPKRRSRHEMQQETQAQLKKAALHLIASGGIAAVSIRGICQRAGFTQGAFYSNFATKEELLLALVEDHTAALAAEFQSIVEETQGLALDASLERMASRMAELARKPTLSLMIVELHLHARRDAEFAARFEPVKRYYRNQFTRITEALITAHGLSPKVTADQLAATLMALWSGATLQIHPQETLSAEKHLLLVFKAVSNG